MFQACEQMCWEKMSEDYDFDVDACLTGCDCYYQPDYDYSSEECAALGQSTAGMCTYVCSK